MPKPPRHTSTPQLISSIDQLLSEQLNINRYERGQLFLMGTFLSLFLPSLTEQISERPGAVQGAPDWGAAERTLDGEGRSERMVAEGRTTQFTHDSRRFDPQILLKSLLYEKPAPGVVVLVSSRSETEYRSSPRMSSYPGTTTKESTSLWIP